MRPAGPFQVGRRPHHPPLPRPWAKRQMEVIGHYAIAHSAYRRASACLWQPIGEGVGIIGIVQDSCPPIASLEAMVTTADYRNALCKASWHCRRSGRPPQQDFVDPVKLSMHAL